MTLNDKQKYEIVILNEQGYTNKYIAGKMKINRHTVERWLNRYKNNNNVNRQDGSGRRKETSTQEDKIIFNTIKKNKLLSAKDICEKIKDNDINVCTKTVINRLHELGVMYNYPKEKPLLTKDQIKKRLKWAIKHKDTNWNEVGFSDETSIQIGLSGKKDGLLTKMIMKKQLNIH